MKKAYFILIGLLLTFLPTTVFAHPGKTDSKGCHTCHTNCPSWGLEYEEYHCHSGNTYKNKKGQTYTNDGNLVRSSTTKNSTTKKNNTTTSKNNSTRESTSQSKIEAKSSNAKLKEVKVDSEVISINESMYVSVKNTQPLIFATAEDEKAKVTVDAPKTFSTSTNEKVVISVLAEDGTKKDYILYVHVLSSNIKIKVFINGKEVSFKNYYSETIYLSSSDEKVNISYNLLDENSKTDLASSKEVKIGDNEIGFTVTAESGKKQQYVLLLHRASQKEEILDSVLTVGVLIAMGFGTFKLVKSIKRKLKK